MMQVKKFTSFEKLKADQKEAENEELSLKRHEEYKKFFAHLRLLVVQQEKSGTLK